MPELPEVETIMRRLRDGTPESETVIGKVIDTAAVYWPKIVEQPDAKQFIADLQSKTITDARRRGKFLHFPLSQGHLIAHLRMSGDMRMEQCLSTEGKPLPRQDYDQVIINFHSDWRMVLSSIRKFSRVWYVLDPKTVLGKLGPEPLGPNLDPDKLYTMLHAHHRQIKPLLMDQSFIAGLGNIYTDEVLFAARVHPLRISDTITKRAAALIRASNPSSPLRLRNSVPAWIGCIGGANSRTISKFISAKGSPAQIAVARLRKSPSASAAPIFALAVKKPPNAHNKPPDFL